MVKVKLHQSHEGNIVYINDDIAMDVHESIQVQVFHGGYELFIDFRGTSITFYGIPTVEFEFQFDDKFVYVNNVKLHFNEEVHFDIENIYISVKKKEVR